MIKTVKFGEHLVFDAYGCKLEKLNNKQLCLDVVNKLTEIAGMRKLMEPYIVEASGNMTLGGKDPGGYSGFVIIQESHISIHTFAKRGFVTIDLYSCKEFPTEGILEYLIKTFEPENYDVSKTDRGLKYPAENIYE